MSRELLGRVGFKSHFFDDNSSLDLSMAWGDAYKAIGYVSIDAKILGASRIAYVTSGTKFNPNQERPEERHAEIVRGGDVFHSDYVLRIVLCNGESRPWFVELFRNDPNPAATVCRSILMAVRDIVVQKKGSARNAEPLAQVEDGITRLLEESL